MHAKPDIAALLGSRICHDLINPIGAISNGVELLMMEGAGNGPEMTLISESVSSANARIRFFRVAFGLSSPEQRIGRTEVVAILADLTAGGRIRIEWLGPDDLPRREVKLAFLLIMCLESAMAYGGKISVARTDSRWMICGQAAKLKIDTTYWELLADPTATPDIGPAHVQFLLVPEEISRQHRRLAAELRETEIRLNF